MKQIKKIWLIVFILSFHFLASPEVVMEDVRLGGLFVVDEQGGIYMNPDNHTICKYSAAGKLLLKIGRKGEGPADIKRLGHFAVNPKDNIIYIAENIQGNKWISRFSQEGKYLGEWQCELDWKKWAGIAFIQFDSQGNVYIEGIKSYWKKFKEFNLGTYESAVLKFSPQGKMLKKIYAFKAEQSAEKRGKGNISIPFRNFLSWRIYNDKIVIRNSRNDFISLLDTGGNLKKKIPLPFEMEKLKKEDIDAWENDVKSDPVAKRGIAEGWFDLKFWRKKVTFPEYKPVSGGRLHIDTDDGFLYSAKYGGYSGNDHRWAKVNISTGETTIIPHALDGYLLTIWKDYCFMARYDEDENVIIVKINKKNMFKKGER